MVKKIKEDVASKVEEKKEDNELKIIESKRNALIVDLRSKLLNKRQLIQGGSKIRYRYEQEKNYQAVVDEINELGKLVGARVESLGSIRLP